MRLGIEDDGKNPRSMTRQELGVAYVREAFGANGTQPDGLLIGDDMVTSGALVELRRRGIEVGKTVQIASNSNAGSPILFGEEANMMRIEYDPRELAEALFRTLDRLMEGKPQPEWVQVYPRICVPGETSGRCPNS
jgi:DNA-binding LacI/PurR family transcriptional regulator